MSDQDLPWTQPSPPQAPTPNVTPEPPPAAASETPSAARGQVPPYPADFSSPVPAALAWGGAAGDSANGPGQATNAWGRATPYAPESSNSRSAWQWVAFGALLAICAGVIAWAAGSEVNVAENDDPISVSKAVVGTCFDWAGEFDEDIILVQCTEEHDAEVFARLTLGEDLNPTGVYPGEVQFIKLGYLACEQAFADYVGIAYSASVFGAEPIGAYSADEYADDPAITCVANAFWLDERFSGSVRQAQR